MLHTEPSFSVYADEDGKGELKVKIGSGEFSFAKTMGLNTENDEDDRLRGFNNLCMLQNEDEQSEPVNGAELKTFDDSGHVAVNCKTMVDEDPSNVVFLKNHAHLLQSNGDLNGAEEYYFRATMADPKDGEILMQYAKLVWELHRDQDRALGFFESAVHAAPEDCDVLAAYAKFLWEIDEDEDDPTRLVEESTEVHAPHLANDLEEYYKRMVTENCCDPLLLKNYARFLQQTKGDLAGAEKYYSRAVKADPGDSEVVSQYAQLLWELHRNQEKASAYFEQSVKDASANSYVLAAYAKFLWEAEDEE